MHEAGIAESLVSAVAQHTPPHRQVHRVTVRVGLLTGVSPEALRFYFEIYREESIGRQAELEVVLEPLRARCGQCGGQCLLSEMDFACPACGAWALEFENGHELDLASLEVDDEPCDHHRTEDPQEERGDRGGEPAAV